GLYDGAGGEACVVPLWRVEWASVLTVEGLVDGDSVDVMEAAFLETGGAQCGICAPGMLLAGHAYLAALPADQHADDDAIREAIAGNLCRCTGYTKIVEAIALAVDRRSADGPGA